MIMKRRNVENGKLRRVIKSKKTSESSYSSIFSYFKFLLVWCFVLLADFILEFRFEYLYPVWLLIRSVQDSYKYQGVLLTALFVMAAIGADIFFYLFIPVQWLFFAASSYVWVQYVWQTDKGLCLSSVSLWLLFIYVEGALRLKETKAPWAFNMDLTRPFAAHCIGYPVVTLGYGIKTAATESLRRRTRRKVKKSNHFYEHLLQEALPIELQKLKLTDDLNEDVTASSEHAAKSDSKGDDISDSCSEASDSGTSLQADTPSAEKQMSPSNGTLTDKLSLAGSTLSAANQNNDSGHDKNSFIEEFDVNAENEARELHRRTVNDLNEEAENMLNISRSKKVPNKDPLPAKKLNPKKNRNSAGSGVVPATAAASTPSVSNDLKPAANPDSERAKSDFITSRLESDIKKLKADLQASRNTESELRSQLNSKSSEERQKKLNLSQLQQDNDNLQNKLHNIVVSRQQEKQNLAALEKKLDEEKKLREKTEVLLTSERKAKKEEDQVAARAVALATANRAEQCDCKSKMNDLEDNNSKLQWEGNRRDDQIRLLMAENSDLRRHCQENHGQMSQELVKTAVNGYQIRIAELQSSLSTETKMKIELYQALGDYKRQCELQTQIMAAKDMEIAGLRSHITEALALVPSSMYTDQSLVSGQYTTPKLGTPSASASPSQVVFPSHPPHPAAPQYAVSPPHHAVVPISPRFSPTSQRVMAECSSPSKLVNNDTGYSELNPKAKDYLPGVPTTQ